LIMPPLDGGRRGEREGKVGRGTRVLSSKQSAITVRPRAFVKVGRRKQCEGALEL